MPHILVRFMAIEDTEKMKTSRRIASIWASFGPVVLLSLFWKRSNKQGAIAGMITGGVMIFVWKYLIKPMGGAFGIYELLPAFVLALIVNIVVCLMTSAPSKEITDTFEAVKAEK